ncbi:MAG TPA: ABC transporter permease subunit [Gemmata sp.]|nr:ABC transporter permease subunit [Gemmata sp.]
MTLILVRKLFRDVRPALIAVCTVLFVFATLWVKISQVVTVQITPVFNLVASFAGDSRLFQDVIFRGPGKVSQAALGWGDLNFEQPNDFLAMGMLHPIVLSLCVIWAVGRSAGAVAGELDRGTMELLLSQPIPRNRLIVAHFLVDLIVLPVICLSFFAGTQFGLAIVGPFIPDYSALKDIKLPIQIPEKPEPLGVSGLGEPRGLTNTFGLMFAISGMTIALSAAGRSRWKVIGYAVLIVVVMFVANTIGQLWQPAQFTRPLTFFFYYQPQKVMLDGDWLVNVGKAWSGAPTLPGVGVLLGVGLMGYLIALWTFTRRDLPAPL